MQNKKKILITILTISLVQMSSNGLSPIISKLALEFPNESISKIQFLMTFPGIFIVICNFISLYLSSRISRKKLIVIGLGLVTVSSLLAVLIHSSLDILFIFGAILGCGVGFVVPHCYSLITDNFDADEKGKIIGWQTSAANLGSMLMTFLGGILASIIWFYNYFVFLIAVPGIVVTLLFLPASYADRQPNKKEKLTIKEYFSNDVIFAVVTGFIFMVICMTVPTNISLIIGENSAEAGFATTLFLLAGTFAGLIFGKIDQKIDRFILALGFILLSSGLLVLSNNSNIFWAYLGCIVAGISVSFIMPKCMEIATSASNKPSAISMAIALMMTAGNLGTFCTPIMTNISYAIGISEAPKRMLFYAAISAFLAFITFVIIKKRPKVN
jgi:MFS family permease